MGELCIDIAIEVKPAFRKAAKALDKNDDGKLCKSDVPGISPKNFEHYVNFIRIPIMIGIGGGKKIHRDQLALLEKLASQNKMDREEVLKGVETDKKGRVIKLNLSKTKVVDIFALGGLTELREIDLSYTDVADVRVLVGLEKLTKVNITETMVSANDAEALRTMDHIKEKRGVLYPRDVREYKEIEKRQRGILEEMAGQNSLEYDELIKSVRFDSSYHGRGYIIELRLAENKKITDIRAIRGLKHLRKFNLRGTGVSDINVLAGLKDLEVLDLSGTNVANFEVLTGLTKLVGLDLSETNFQDTSLLASLVQLRWISLLGTKVNDIGVLDALPRLAVKIYQTEQADPWVRFGWQYVRSSQREVLGKLAEDNKIDLEKILGPKRMDLDDEGYVTELNLYNLPLKNLDALFDPKNNLTLGKLTNIFLHSTPVPAKQRERLEALICVDDGECDPEF